MASETLQRKMDEILGNIPNCMAIADDAQYSLQLLLIQCMTH